MNAMRQPVLEPAKTYDHWLGNYKTLLIFLVVFGHMVEAYRTRSGNEIVHDLYNVIYLLHMPAFIFMSGYFFRKLRPEKLIGFIALYAIWYTIHVLDWAFVEGVPYVEWNDRLLAPYVPMWTLWFLIGVILWQAVTPLFLQLRYPLLWSVLLAVFIAMSPDPITKFFSLHKVVSFYPFFLLGYLVKEKGWLAPGATRERLTATPARLAALAFVVLTAAFMWWWQRNGFKTEWLFLRDRYREFDVSLLTGIMTHLFIYALSAAMLFAVLILLPKRSLGQTMDQIGIQTLAIYLIHTIAVRFFREYVPPAIADSPSLLIGVSLIGSVMLVLVLSNRYVTMALRPLLQPDLSWLLRRKKMKP